MDTMAQLCALAFVPKSLPAWWQDRNPLDIREPDPALRKIAHVEDLRALLLTRLPLHHAAQMLLTWNNGPCPIGNDELALHAAWLEMRAGAKA